MLEAARSLYAQGVAKFEMFDYIGAIDLWTQAYAKLPEGDDVTEVKAAIVHNTAVARTKAYEIDKEVAHLEQAKRLRAEGVKVHDSGRIPRSAFLPIGDEALHRRIRRVR